MGVESPISVQVVGLTAGGLESPFSATDPMEFGPSTEMFGEIPAEFMLGGSYALENMPLADSIPLDRNPDPGKKMTAIHELQHAVVGLANGNDLVAMSVNPEGATLGWTLFKGEVDPATAAAGSVDTVFGPASGFGGDLATVTYLGSSISSAQTEAQAIISGFDRDFLAIASEIIALKGFVTAADFGEVCRRAEFELAWRNSGFDLKEVLALQGIEIAKDYKDDQSDKGKLVIPDSGTYSLIETFADQIMTTTFVDGKIKAQTVVCPRCGVEGGGHLPNCEAVKGKENSTSTAVIGTDKFSIDSTEYPDFPQDAVIFSG